MKVFNSIEELRAAVGTDLGHSEWHTVDQEQIDLFARATGDFQWIHVDPERAATGPFGTTIAHGYLTLSLLPSLVSQVYRVDGLKMGINYGSNKVRFPAPLPVDSRVRAAVRLAAVNDTPAGTQAVVEVVIEREGGDKPVCVAEAISLLIA